MTPLQSDRLSPSVYQRLAEVATSFTGPMLRLVCSVLFTALAYNASADVHSFDCKIEGRKGLGYSTELLVCRVREGGEFVGMILLRAPTEPDQIWITTVEPAAIRAMDGDNVYMRIHCEVGPLIKLPGQLRSPSLITMDELKASDWTRLGVTKVQVISQSDFLGITPKPQNP